MEAPCRRSTVERRQHRDRRLGLGRGWLTGDEATRADPGRVLLHPRRRMGRGRESAAAVVSPGSRSAPMALALVADGRLEVQVRLDERSAGFMALGIGLCFRDARRRAHDERDGCCRAPSGRRGGGPRPRAAHRLHGRPAARAAGRRSAPDDRAARPLRGSVRFALDAGVAGRGRARRIWRSLGSRLVAEALAGPAGPGPVHVNLAFREPLLAPRRRRARTSRPAARDGQPVARRRPPARPAAVRAPARGAAPARSPPERPGSHRRRRPLRRPRRRARARRALLGWPLLADPRSGCRRPGPAGAVVVAAADALLRVERLQGGSPARGRAPPRRAVGIEGARRLARRHRRGRCRPRRRPTRTGRGGIPGREAAVQLPCDPGELVAALLAEGDGPRPGRRGGDAGGTPRRAGAVVGVGRGGRTAGDRRRLFGDGDELTEPFIARHVSGCAGVGTIVVASSMPVRDLEWFGEPVRAAAEGLLEPGRQRHRRGRLDDSRRGGRRRSQPR